MLLKYFFPQRKTKLIVIKDGFKYLIFRIFGINTAMFGCVCVCVCVCVYTFDKTVPEEKEIRCPRKSIFCFFASFYISNNYIMVSVIQVESIQGGLTESLIKLGKNCKRPKGGNIYLLDFVRSIVYLSEKTFILPCLSTGYRLISGTRHQLQSNFDSSKCLGLSTFFRTIRISNLPSRLFPYCRKNTSVQNNRVYRENV